MPNVTGLIAPERILSDICRLVADSLKGTANENEIQVTGTNSGSPLARIKLFTNFGRQSVQFSVPEFDPLRKRVIDFGKGPDAVVKNP